MVVANLGPQLAPFIYERAIVPIATLQPEIAMLRLGQGAHRQQHMGVRLGQAVTRHFHVESDVGDHAPLDEGPVYIVQQQGEVLIIAELARQHDLRLAGQLGVDPALAQFDPVPQIFAHGALMLAALGRFCRHVAHPGGRVGRRQKRGRHHAGAVALCVSSLGAEIPNLAGAVIDQPVAGAIGGLGHDASMAGAGAGVHS